MMKKRIILLSAVAGIGYLTLSSYQAGPATQGWNCTGADINTGAGNPTGCVRSGCHGTAVNTGITVAIELDSAGVVTSSTAMGVGHYVPGFTYTVKITGTNTTAYPLPYFGFQGSCTKGATAAASGASLVNCGTLQSTGFPSNMHFVTALRSSTTFYANVVEHHAPIPATTGGGATGSTYVVSYTWTAPPTGTGAASMWAAVNAVNHNGGADGGDLSNTNQLVLNEALVNNAVATVENNLGFKVYPNPVANQLNLDMEHPQTGSYSISVFDVSGRMISASEIEVNGSQKNTINSGDWLPGTYRLVVEKDGKYQVIPVVKL
jgi:hypothetical protein